MDQQGIEKLMEKQYRFFQSQETLSLKFRLKALNKLKKALLEHEENLMKALWEDLHKSSFETFAHELGQVLKELDVQRKHLISWAKPRRKRSPLSILPSKSYVFQEPYGNVLIMSPWNYPLLLLIDPLIGAIAAGNTVVLKPSPYLKAFSIYLDRMIGETFPRKYIAVVHGDRTINQVLLKQKWDYIFFTGSNMLGKLVMKAAAENLTPVTLELGGKSPCIVDDDANLKLAARRIVWGKFINAGQTCIAPDYLLVHEKVKDELLSLMKLEIKRFYGDNPQKSPDLCRIVNDQAFERLSSLLTQGTIVAGGITDPVQRYIAPTIIDGVDPDFDIMQEEIFGPLLPVLTFSQLPRAIDFVNSCDKPLAFYFFSNDLQKARRVIAQTSSGGACINDTILHIANGRLPFGGVGKSGMGKYHGRYSFETFSNQRSIVFSSRWLDLPFKYPPYGNKLKWMKKLITW
ncbi:MAG: aldehyde dehydrogenase [Prolixibacteraceae bacterium]|nr:aldehyde dehydrogenase [Prolixibacteraceae bacterium]